MKSGDLVKLKSGGPDMTTTRSMLYGAIGQNKYWECVWFEEENGKQILKKCEIAEEALENKI